MDFAFGEPQTMSEFLLVAALEVLLLSYYPCFPADPNGTKPMTLANR